ncbi:MAG: hypothetical protein AAF430_14065 [Myxococcota bacterium]
MSAAANERAAQLLERVRAVVPQLAEEAAASEELRRPTDRAVELVRDSGVFRALLPREYGGDALDLDTFCDVGMTLGEADTSLAWWTTFLVEHNWLFCHFPESFSKSLYADAEPVLAPAAIHGESSCRTVDGGFVLDGRWRWGSGSSHCSWVMVGGDPGGDGGPAPRFFAVPRDQVEIDDVWHVAGMRATASNDVVLHEVFVPEEQSMSLLDAVSGNGRGARLWSDPIFRTPMVPVLMTAASTPIIGQARSVVRRFAEKTAARVRMLGSKPESAKSSIQRRIAEAEAGLQDAERRMRDTIADVMARRGDASMLDRARWALAMTRSVHQARDTIQLVSNASGGSAQFSTDPLQRALRDANVVVGHIAFDADARHELYGRLRVGLSPDSFLV